MALPQNDKAIFYHPLDTAAESLKSRTWAETTATFSPAKVSSGLFGSPSAATLAHVPDVATFGAENEYLTGTQEPLVGMAMLTAAKFVVCYSDATTGLSRIWTVSGTSITYGAESVFESASSGTMDPIDVASLSSTSVAIVYQVNSPAARYVKAGTVTGADVTWGTGISYFGGTTSRNSISSLDSTKFVIVYRRDSTTSMAARVGTISGSSVTIGAQKVGTSSGVDDTFDVVGLDSTKFVVLWHSNLSGGNYWGKTGTVTGTVITFGAAASFSTATGSAAAYIASDALSSTSILIAYRDGADFGRGTAKIATVSGSTITYGVETEFLTADATNIDVAAISSTTAVVTYRKETGGDCATKIATVSGIAITFAAETVFVASNGGVDVTNKAAVMDATTFVVAYRDISDLNHGTAKVGSTDPYGTAVSSSRVAFAGWMRKPSA